MSEEISAVKLQQKAILEVLEEVKALRIQNTQKDQHLVYQESHVAELEQYTRVNDVIVTGLRIKPQSYAWAVTADGGGGPCEQDISSGEQQVAAFLQSKGIELDSNNIEACHPLPRRNDKDNPAKTALLKQGRKLKGSNVFINEHLTEWNADIARKARYLKKQGKNQSTWTTNCKIFIKLNGTPEQVKVLVIGNIEELDKYRWSSLDWKVGLPKQ